MTSRSRLSTLACAAGILFSISTTYARVVTFSVYEFRRSSDFQGSVEKLQVGDEVHVDYADPKELVVFKLDALLPEGTQGRVFKARNQKGEVVAVKFQRKSEDAGVAMKLEVQGIDYLEKMKIPVVKILRHDSDFYIEKELIDGDTLQDTLLNWTELSKADQDARMKELVNFFGLVSRPGTSISDLNAYNIMWDKNQSIWKIIDPGTVQFAMDVEENVVEMNKAIDEVGPHEMSTTFHAMFEKAKLLSDCIARQIAK